MRTEKEIRGSLEKLDRLLEDAEGMHHAVVLELQAKKVALVWALQDVAEVRGRA